MWLEYLKLSLRQLWAHKLRSFLTVLSITIGVASIVAMTSLAKSGFGTLTRGIEELGGTRFIAVFKDQPKAAKGKADHYAHWLTMGDRDALARAVPNLESIVASSKMYHFPVMAGAVGPIVTTGLATEPGYFRAYKMEVAEGRALSAHDMAARARVAVIGQALAKQLYGRANGVGRELQFRGERYRVVGVLTLNPKSNINMGYNWDEVLIMPLSAPGVGSEVEQIDLVVKRTEDSEPAVRVIHQVLMHRHNQVDNFMILHFAGLLKNFYLAFAVMQMVVAVIAGIALLIGGVGVMNIMLVAVTERMREIGLRKALGASGRAIRNQFLIESTILSLFGAAIGVGVGYGVTVGASMIIRQLNPAWVSSFSYGAIGVAVVSSAAIGLFFGWYPAKVAAELDPILCLRHE